MESNMVLVINLVLIAGLMTVLWLVSLRIRNASIVDVFWGTGTNLLGNCPFHTTLGGYIRGDDEESCHVVATIQRMANDATTIGAKSHRIGETENEGMDRASEAYFG